MRKGLVVALAIISCLIVSVPLYYLQGQFTWINRVVVFLGILAVLMQIAGISLSDLADQVLRRGKGIDEAGRRLKSPPTPPEIGLRRKYREGPILEEEVTFRGREALARYVDGSSRQILERSTLVVGEIALAVELEKEGRLDEADAKAREAISLLRNNPVKGSLLPLCQAYLIRGDIAFSKELFQQAEQHYRSSYELATITGNDFLTVSSAKGLAIALGSQGNSHEALKILDETLKNHPGEVDLWYNKGVAFSDLGKYDEALAASEKAIGLNPRFAEPWTNKGVALSHLGKHDEALAAYEKAIELNPRSVEPWTNKSATLGELGRHAESLAAIEKAIELDPKFALAWYNKGAALFHLGKYDEASEAADRAVQFGIDLEDAKKIRRVIETAKSGK